jgi:diguanylate cyclase (GGDEF)-like protein
MKKTSRNVPVALKVVFGIAAIVFISAAILLGALNGLGVESRTALAVVITSALLAAVAAPSVYWLMCAAVRREECGVEAAEDMSVLTVTDPLTHVMNRRGITMGVLEAMAQAERYNTPLSVAMVDVDRLQRVNDQFGRSAGDKALADIAGVLADTLRMPDKVGRYGGEEFLLVLPHTGLTQARKIAERIHGGVGNAKLSANGKRVSLTVSIGVTQYTKGKDLEHLLSRANAAVMEAKRDGGNRVVAKKSG